MTESIADSYTEPPFSIRDTLFGDAPFASWAEHGSSGEPWTTFHLARVALDSGKKPACIELLTDITGRQGLETRHYVQAWHFLRQLGVTPPKEKEKELLGVVVEVGLHGGHDLVAAYPDWSARYYNYSGAGIVWEHPDGRMTAPIQRLLDAGRILAGKIGPWEKPRPAAPPQGYARINLLTPSGLHFGQGPINVLASDALGGPVIAAALALMRELIKETQSGSGSSK